MLQKGISDKNAAKLFGHAGVALFYHEKCFTLCKIFQKFSAFEIFSEHDQQLARV
jgi:hypothetical protein